MPYRTEEEKWRWCSW